MSHAEKVRRMIEGLARRGVSEWTSAPPIYRLAWKLGLELTPPPFASFGELFVFQSVFFGLLWGVLMSLVVWPMLNVPMVLALPSAVMTGLLFGLVMAIVLRGMARKHQLPRWEDYGLLHLRLDQVAPGVKVHGVAVNGLIPLRRRLTFGCVSENDVCLEGARLAGRTTFDIIPIEKESRALLGNHHGGSAAVRVTGASPISDDFYAPFELKPGAVIEPIIYRTGEPAARFVVVED